MKQNATIFFELDQLKEKYQKAYKDFENFQKKLELKYGDRVSERIKLEDIEKIANDGLKYTIIESDNSSIFTFYYSDLKDCFWVHQSFSFYLQKKYIKEKVYDWLDKNAVRDEKWIESRNDNGYGRYSPLKYDFKSDIINKIKSEFKFIVKDIKELTDFWDKYKKVRTLY
jgi:hypothetical protein